MRVYKHISFREGIKCTLTEFKKTFAANLVGLSASEVKEAHKIATDGNISKRSTKSEKTNSK